MDSKDCQSDILSEFADLQEEVIDAIHDAMQDGIEHGYQGDWRDINFEEHIDHAIMHLVNIDKEDDDHLSHAICRLAMASWVHYHGESDGDSGSDDEGDDTEVDKWIELLDEIKDDFPVTAFEYTETYPSSK